MSTSVNMSVCLGFAGTVHQSCGTPRLVRLSPVFFFHPLFCRAVSVTGTF